MDEAARSRVAQGFYTAGGIAPRAPHEQWHTDISYLNIAGTHYFFIAVLDGFSRSVIHHDIKHITYIK